jgi:XTP/dITP diphosphohydrolase
MPFDEKISKLLRMMTTFREPTQRCARFRCHVALAAPGGGLTTFEATCEGQIAFKPSGSGGFGYDPIFWLPELGCTMADLTAEEKHAISHRGKVLGLVIGHLTQRLSPVQ